MARYRWRARGRLVAILRHHVRQDRRVLGSDEMEEKLTDLSRDRSSLAGEAHAALHLTDDAQWERLIRDLRAAIKDMPNCLRGSRCDDSVAIDIQARRDAEPPLTILRDLVRTELDLIHEGEVSYEPMQQTWIRNYWNRLLASC